MRLYQRLSRSGTKSLLRGEEGYGLSLVLIWTLILMVQLSGLANYAANGSQQVRLQKGRVQAFYLAEAATQSAGAQVRLFIQKNGRQPTDAELTVIAAQKPFLGSQCEYDDMAVAYNGNVSGVEAIEFGDYAGLNATKRTIDITASVKPSADMPAVTLTQNYEIQSIPVFQFGVFYQGDLEILPGADMTFAGPVHTNKDMYLGVGSGSTATLEFDSSITSAGSLYHERKDGGAIGTGPVSIKDTDGDYQPMLKDGVWLDSHSASWTSGALERWGGTVKTSDHGAASLSLPISSSVQSHDIIERRSGADSTELQSTKLDYKSQLRLVDGQALNSAGQTVELRYCTKNGVLTGNVCSKGVVVNPVTTTTFYDAREQKTINSTDVDVSLLKSSPAFSTMVNSNNGVIVYFSDNRNPSATTENALRLVNGSSLPTKGVTFAAGNPLYVKGDFNTTSKKPAGLVSDSVTILSGSWTDANSAKTIANRTASSTSVNAAVMTGNVETAGNAYSGGFENVHRFLENWSGRTLTYKGSVEVFYSSETATGAWGKSNVYSPPNRNWSFDDDFIDDDYTIPGFPSVYNVAKGVWARD